MPRTWLLTWTTYGTWLPGDARGFGGAVRDQAGSKVVEDQPGTEYFSDLPSLERYAESKLKCEPTYLTQEQAECLHRQFLETATVRGWRITAGAIMPNHAHLLVEVDNDPDPEQLLRDFKSYGSRALNRRWPRSDGRWWTKSGSTRKMPHKAASIAAKRYVRQQRGALVIFGEEQSGEPPAGEPPAGEPPAGEPPASAGGLSAKASHPPANAGGSPHHPILGLVGGVGCGKSFVAGLFAELGAAVLAGDPLGHEALRQPEIIQQLVARWGQGILNDRGEIDRAKVGAIVFQQPDERKFLEQLTHPWIRARLREQLAKLHADPAVPLIIMDAAVMLESGWSHVCDKLAFIEVPNAVRAERTAKQRGWPPEELARREANQWPLEQKRAKADFIINNGGTADQTRAQVRQVWQTLGLPLP